MKQHIRLGVNIDHVATLRQVRGGTTPYPDLIQAAQWSMQGGAEQITIHLREDRRHIQLSDLKTLSELRLQKKIVPLNLEMAANAQMQKYALKYLPDWCCLVPEKREELTTEGGLNVIKAQTTISNMIEKLQVKGIETSLFIEPNLKQVKASFEVGGDAIELHTGKWVLLKGQKQKDEWKRLVEAAEYAHSLGLSVHAGHGLDFVTTAQIISLPHVQELNIGHSLICYSIEMGLAPAVKKMRQIMDGKKS